MHGKCLFSVHLPAGSLQGEAVSVEGIAMFLKKNQFFNQVLDSGPEEIRYCTRM